MINETNNLPRVSVSLKNIIQQKYFIKNPSLSCLNFNENGDFLIISTNEISENLRHIDPLLDRVLHQLKSASLISFHIYLFFLLKKPSKNQSLLMRRMRIHIWNRMFTIKSQISKMMSLITIESPFTKIILVVIWFFSFTQIHGSSCSLTMFTNSIPWITLFFLNIWDNTSILSILTCVIILFLLMLDWKLITPVCDANYVVLIKTTQKYSLTESFINPHHFFVTDNRIYMSCMDELIVRLEESDILNSKKQKLDYRGFIMKIKIDDFEPVHIAYVHILQKNHGTGTKRSQSPPKFILRLYQIDKLNSFLQTFNDSYTDVVKRINVSMSTMSREILDIYHMTRKKNSDLYNVSLLHTNIFCICYVVIT